MPQPAASLPRRGRGARARPARQWVRDAARCYHRRPGDVL